MSRSEDYLDNLLTSVTDRLNEFDDDFEQNRESFKESYQTQNDLPSKTQSALDEIREENFLREFEDELNKGRADEDFLAEFERELNGEDVQPAAQEEPELDLLDELFSQMNEEKDDQTIEMPQPDQTDADPFADMRTMEPDEAASSSDEHTLEPDFLSDEDLTSMLKEPEEEPAVPDLTSMLKEPEEEPAIPDFSGFDDEPATAAMDSGNDEATTALNDEEPQTVAMDTQEQEKSMEAPKGMEGLEDIFGDILGDDADSLINELENGTLSEDADRTQQNTEPILDDRLKDILDGSDEDALSEIDQLLDADSDSGTQEKEDPLAMAPDFSYEESSLGDGETGEKKKREKNKNGLFGKISRMLFGTPAELDPEAAAEYEAAKAAMKQTEEDPKAVKERKKQEKELVMNGG